MRASAAYSSCCTAAWIAFFKPAACLRLTRVAFKSVTCRLGGSRDTTATPACSRALMRIQLQHSTAHMQRHALVQPDAEVREFGGGDNVHEHHVTAKPAEAGVREGLLRQARALLLEYLRQPTRQQTMRLTATQRSCLDELLQLLRGCSYYSQRNVHLVERHECFGQPWDAGAKILAHCKR